jgi:hypothetical protein
MSDTISIVICAIVHCTYVLVTHTIANS